MFTAGGKSFIRTVQSIGRGLRLHANKDQLVIYDICDNLKYSKQHSDKRKQIYEKEKINFTEKIVKLG
jgi:superfamily II DNA or RNA helicase